ncbi:hypothetical protein V8C86DRAFT_2817428 [Haematococcus lacustris]
MSTYQPVDEAASSGELPYHLAALGVVLPSLLVFILMDVAWIALVAGPLFKKVLGPLMRPQPGILAGLLAWLIIVTGVWYFAAAAARTPQRALTQGLLLGAVIYGTYELTNTSVISTWTWSLAAADMAWGSFACGMAALTQQQLQRVWLMRR